MDHDIQDYFNTALQTAKTAGEVVKEAYYKEKKTDEKECHADLVTETDQAVEKLIIGLLSQKYPNHKFIGEESVAEGQKCDWTDAPTWIIDPIDGTTNFVHRIPYTCICIGLSINKQVVVGVVHLPIMEQTFTAIKGQGAFCNQEKLSVSKQKELKNSMVIVEGGSQRDPTIVDTKMETIKHIVYKSRGIRMFGSAASNICLVASGVAEAYTEYGMHIWDLAAAGIILTEAGGLLLDPTGKELDYLGRGALAACTKEVAEEIASLTSPIAFQRD